MNTLENRLLVDEEINAYEQILVELYKERKMITKNCKHEIRIRNLEEVEYFPYFLENREYCLLCGKEFSNTFPDRHIKIRNNCIIQMTNYPNLSEKWGKNYRSEVEKVCLGIKRVSSCSDKEIFLMLRDKLEELEEGMEE